MIDDLTDQFIMRGAPAFIRSGDGLEFAAKGVPDWIAAVGANTACNKPSSLLSG
jgi:putative transposase